MPRRGPLARLDPLAKIAGPLPAMVFLVLTRDPWTPGAFLLLTVLLLATAAGRSRRQVLTGIGLGALAGVLMTASLSLLVSTEAAAAAPGGAVWVAASTALRLLALVALVLIGGLTTDGPALVRSLVAHLRLPYRIGYAALAAYRFVPRFGRELEIIHSAHRVRGAVGGGRLERVRRVGRTAVPLLASGVRHAERVALAMDARAFGAGPRRTERHEPRFGVREVAFVLGCWALSVGVVAVVATSGLMAPLVLA